MLTGQVSLIVSRGRDSLRSLIGLDVVDTSSRHEPPLTRMIVQDLNEDWRLPLEDESVDVIMLVNGVFYLQYPLEIWDEFQRVLRRNGVVVVVQGMGRASGKITPYFYDLLAEGAIAETEVPTLYAYEKIAQGVLSFFSVTPGFSFGHTRSEEHTSELQSR